MAKRVKWTTNKINKVRRALRNGLKQKEIADLFKVSQGTISMVIAGIEREKAEKILEKKAPVADQPTTVENTEIGGVYGPNLQTLEEFLRSNPPMPPKKRGRKPKVKIPDLTVKPEPKRRGRPKKNTAEPSILHVDSVKKEISEAAGMLDEAEKIIKQLESELSTANDLLKKIGEMSWFQRKDCGKLIENYFQNHLA